MQDFWARSRAFGLTIAVHIIVVAVVVFGTMDWKPFRPPMLTGLSIEAVMVDTTALKKRREQARKEAQQAVQRQAEKERREKELKARQERQEKEKRAREAAEKQRLKELAAKKRQEDMRLQKLREKQVQDRKERDRKRKEELARLRQQREKATREARIEEERLNQLKARRQAEAENQRQAIAAADLQRQVDAEARAGKLASLEQQYKFAIQTQVTNNWLRPPTARAGLRCTLRILQIPGGEVISATIAGSCNADEATRRSLVAAVERAGTLPYRGFEDVFQREIDFLFKYDGD